MASSGDSEITANKRHSPAPSPRTCSGVQHASSAPARGELDAGTSPARSEEHTSELQSLMRISYAVFCLKKKKINRTTNYKTTIKQLQTQKVITSRTLTPHPMTSIYYIT